MHSNSIWSNAGGDEGTRGDEGRRGTGERSLLKKLRKTFMRGMGMDIVCENPIASQCGSVQYMRRSFASGWTEPSAFYGERVRDIVSCAVVGYSTYYTILEMERNLQVPLPFIRHIADPFAVSANPTKDDSPTPRSRRHEQPLPPIMKNERPKLGTPTETRTIQSRTQIAVQNSELGSNESTGIHLPKSL